jgi:hypothetical protein
MKTRIVHDEGFEELKDCCICGKPIEYDTDRHTFHDEDCVNHSAELKGLPMVVMCTCYNACHKECCPVCKERIQAHDAPR